MELWVGIAIAVGIVGMFVVAHRYGWIDLSNKSKTSGRSGGSALGIGDEVFHPTRHEAQLEMDRQTVLPAPAPLPGDGDPSTGSGQAGIYEGQVRIDLTR